MTHFEDYHDTRIPEPSWLAGPDWYEDAAPLRCGDCGAFLPSKPDRSAPWEDGLDCDGSESFINEVYSEGMVQILGEEYRGKTYPISVSPCGIDEGKHAPHREIFAAGVLEWRTCRKCGAEQESSI